MYGENGKLYRGREDDEHTLYTTYSSSRELRSTGELAGSNVRSFSLLDPDLMLTSLFSYDYVAKDRHHRLSGPMNGRNIRIEREQEAPAAWY